MTISRLLSPELYKSDQYSPIEKINRIDNILPAKYNIDTVELSPESLREKDVSQERNKKANSLPKSDFEKQESSFPLDKEAGKNLSEKTDFYSPTPGEVGNNDTGKADISRVEPEKTGVGEEKQRTRTGRQSGKENTRKEKRILAKLQGLDRDVRAHEMAHISAAGGFVKGGAQFILVTGPDGKQYAVGGEVGIDTSPVSDNPEATIVKAQTVRRAALAPSNPSPQDRQVASAAGRMEQMARMQLTMERLNEQQAPDIEGVEIAGENGELANPYSGGQAVYPLFTGGKLYSDSPDNYSNGQIVDYFA